MDTENKRNDLGYSKDKRIKASEFLGKSFYVNREQYYKSLGEMSYKKPVWGGGHGKHVSKAENDTHPGRFFVVPIAQPNLLKPSPSKHAQTNTNTNDVVAGERNFVLPPLDQPRYTKPEKGQTQEITEEEVSETETVEPEETANIGEFYEGEQEEYVTEENPEEYPEETAENVAGEDSEYETEYEDEAYDSGVYDEGQVDEYEVEYETDTPEGEHIVDDTVTDFFADHDGNEHTTVSEIAHVTDTDGHTEDYFLSEDEEVDSDGHIIDTIWNEEKPVEEEAENFDSLKNFDADCLDTQKPSDNFDEIISGEEEQDEPKDPKSKKRKILIGAGVSAVLVAGLAGGVIGYSIYADSFTKVPAAIKTITYGSKVDPCKPFIHNKLDCEIKHNFSDVLINGALISQSINPGEEVKKGDKVTLIYSKGQKTVEMPNLTGLPLKKAEQKLYNANIKVKSIVTKDSVKETKKNIVIATSIKPGEKIENGQSVVLTISTGNSKAPNWLGKSKEFIENDAKTLGMTVNFIEKDSDTPAGLAIGQTPAPDMSVTNATVTVTLSKAKEETQIEIPDVVGKSKSEAQTALVQAGFTKVTAVVVENNQVTSEQVTQIVPTAGTKVGSNSNVVIIVSKPIATPPSGTEQTTPAQPQNN